MSSLKIISSWFCWTLSVHLRYSEFLPITCTPVFQVGVQTKPKKEMSFHASVDMKKKVDLFYVWCPFAGFSLVSLLCLETEHSLCRSRCLSSGPCGKCLRLPCKVIRLSHGGGSYLRFLSKVMHPTLVIQSIFAYSIRPWTFQLSAETSLFNV